MRLLTIIFVACCLHFSTQSFCQTITFSGRGVALQKVFTEIEKQTDYVVVCNSKLISNAPPVTVNAKNMPLQTFIKEILKGQTLDFFIENQTITIRRKVNGAQAATPPESSAPLPSALREISGLITDSLGHPLPGVSVKIIGRTSGTATDQNGRFSVKADSSELLSFSHIGYEPKTIRAALAPRISGIVLSQLSTEMDEVSVVSNGYQTRDKRQMVGSVSTVTAKDMETAGTVTIDKAISGKVPGVYVRSTSGKPGEIGQIMIRGVNTLTGNTEPLYVLDGMPLQDNNIGGNVSRIFTTGIGNIPPEDIESITILRDATAAAIYGARAANGVVVITTKTGKVGKDYVTYTGKVTITEPPKSKFNFMDSQEKIDFERGLYNDYHPVYGGRVVQLLGEADNGTITQQDAENQIAQLGQTNTDWASELYRTGLSHSHNISMSGGNLRTQYFASLNYQSDQGTLLNNNYQTGGMNLKLSHYLNKDFLLRFSLYTTLKSNKYTSSYLDPFKYAQFANPYEKPYNADGSYASDESYLDRSGSTTIGQSSALSYNNLNIIREIKGNTLTSMYGDMRGQIDLEYTFLKGFRFVSSTNLDYSSIHNMDESDPGTYRSYYYNWVKGGIGAALLPQFNRGFLKEDMARTLNYTVRNSLEYNKTFAEKHFVQAYLAQDISGTKNFNFNHFDPIYDPEYRIVGYPSWGDINSNATGDIPYSKYNPLKLNAFGGTGYGENRSASFISSLVYSYDNRYVFNGNWRMDGVDIIGSSNQFTPLWSAGFKWNMNNEAFMKPYNDIITRLVPSIGYGYRGSINRSVYPFHVYTVGSNTYDGSAVASAISYGNPVLKWEKKKELNLGLELSMYKGRINMEGRYYNEHVSDLLDNVMLPASIGRSSTTANVGTLSNKGWELSARVEMVKTKELLVEVGGNISFVTNRLTNVYNKLTPNISSNATANAQGYAVNSWYGYKFSRVNPLNGDKMVWARRLLSTVQDGKVMNNFRDEEIDINTITLADLQANYRTYYLGHIDPNSYGGFNARVVYRNFELSTQFAFASGNRILNFQDRLNYPSSPFTPGGYVAEIDASRTNRAKETANRWRQPGDITNIPKFSNTVLNSSYYLYDTDLGSGAYLRCNQLALTWRPSPKSLHSNLLSDMRVTGEANNVFLVSGYKGTDPETRLAFGYPNTRNYTLSVTLGF